MLPYCATYFSGACPTPHGVGGLKFVKDLDYLNVAAGPTPHGVGGLKSIDKLNKEDVIVVPPLTGWVD